MYVRIMLCMKHKYVYIFSCFETQWNTTQFSIVVCGYVTLVTSYYVMTCSLLKITVVFLLCVY